MGRKKEKTDEEILQAARECFIKHGPAVATGVIARELGVSQATLFNRFHTKRELMFAALKPSSNNRFFEILDSPPDDRPVKEQLVEIGNEAFSYFTETDPRLAVLTAAGMTDEQLRECYAESPTALSRRRLSNWLEIAKQNQRVRDVDTKSFATAYIGAVRCGASENSDIHANEEQAPAHSAMHPAMHNNTGEMQSMYEQNNTHAVKPANETRASDEFIENTVALFWPALDPASKLANA